MKIIEINDLKFPSPSGYNELSLPQLKAVARLMVHNTPFNQIRCLYKLLGLRLRWADRKKWNLISTLPAAWLHTLMADKTLFGWVFDKASLTGYPISKFRYRGIIYHGPADNILNITAGEITFGYNYFKNYAKTNNAYYLDRLVAMLYRPRNPFNFIKMWNADYTGDVRLPLNEYFFRKRIARFASLSPEIKTTIFLQWAGAWEAFENLPQNKYIFPKASAAVGAQQVVPNTPDDEDPMLWQKIMLRMAESGVFGTMHQVEQMDKDRFFLCMTKNIEEWMQKKDAMARS